MISLSFTVRGIPQTKGSARAFTYTRKPEKGGGIGARVDNDNPKSKAWQADVAKSAWVARGGGRRSPHPGPVQLTVEFYLPMPKKPKSLFHVTKPDIDKLLRCVIDGMTGVLFLDDSQVTDIIARKSYAPAGDAPGVDITVSPTNDTGPLLQGID